MVAVGSGKPGPKAHRAAALAVTMRPYQIYLLTPSSSVPTTSDQAVPLRRRAAIRISTGFLAHPQSVQRADPPGSGKTGGAAAPPLTAQAQPRIPAVLAPTSRPANDGRRYGGSADPSATARPSWWWQQRRVAAAVQRRPVGRLALHHRARQAVMSGDGNSGTGGGTGGPTTNVSGTVGTDGAGGGGGAESWWFGRGWRNGSRLDANVRP